MTKFQATSVFLLLLVRIGSPQFRRRAIDYIPYKDLRNLKCFMCTPSAGSALGDSKYLDNKVHQAREEAGVDIELISSESRKSHGCLVEANLIYMILYPHGP